MNEIKKGSDLHERVAKVESDISHIKENISDLQKRQTGAEDSIKEMTAAIREQNAKQEATNKYMEKIIEQNAQFMEKLDKKIELYQEKNEMKFQQLEEENNKQDNDKNNTVNKFLLWFIGSLLTVLGVLIKIIWDALPLIKQ